MKSSAVAAAKSTNVRKFPVQKRKRCEARVPYNREDRRGGETRLTIDESIACCEAFGRVLQLEGIGLYCLLARHPGITAQQIMDGLGIGKDKLRAAVEKVVAANLLQVTRHYGAPSTFTLLAPPHPKDEPKSFVSQFAENPPTEAPVCGKPADQFCGKSAHQFAENPPSVCGKPAD